MFRTSGSIDGFPSEHVQTHPTLPGNADGSATALARLLPPASSGREPQSRRDFPVKRIRRAVFVSFVLELFCVARPGSAQTARTFQDVGLFVNLGDRVQVRDRAGATQTGRVTALTPGYIELLTRDGARRLAEDAVTSVELRRHPLKRGALIGAAGLAVLGGIAVCAHKGGTDCAVAGAAGAAPIGAGIGLTIGSVVPRMRTIYRLGGHARHEEAAGESGNSLLADLGLRVNLDDRVRVRETSGGSRSGRVSALDRDSMTLRTTRGVVVLSRADIEQVALVRSHLRTGVLLGAAAGAGWGAATECRGDARECPDGIVIGTAIGAAAGAFAGALAHTSTVVYSRRIVPAP